MTKTERSLRADLNRARKLLDRYQRWHNHVPPTVSLKDLGNCEAALVLRVRVFLREMEVKHDQQG